MSYNPFAPTMGQTDPILDDVSPKQNPMMGSFQNNMNNPFNPQQPQGIDWGSVNTWFGGMDAQGNMGLGVIPKAFSIGSGVANFLQGSEALRQQRQILEFNKKQAIEQTRINVQELNRRMRDKAEARNRANPNEYETAADYMKRNKIKV